MTWLELPPREETIAGTNNVVDYVRWWAEREPARTAIVFPIGARGGAVVHEAVSYGELTRDVGRTARALGDLGVEKGDRVLIMIPMSRPLYTLLLAVLKVGATAVFVDPWVPLAQIGQAAELTEPKVFAGVARAHWLRLLSRPFRRVPLKLVACSTVPLLPRLLGRSVEGLYAQGPEREATEPVALEDAGLITFTTGSTGAPKGSSRTQLYLDAQGHALAAHLPRADGDVDMPALPVFVLNNLGLGVPSVLPCIDFRRVADVDPALVTGQIEARGVTTIGGSPAYLAPIARYLAAEGRTLERVRAVVTGGAPVPPSLLRALREVCPQARGNIRVLYGSTEAEPVAWIEADEVLGETAAHTEAGKGNCVGRSVEDVELKLVRPDPTPWQLDGRPWEAVEVAPGEVGEVLVTGDHVQKHYYRAPEAERANKVAGPDGRVWHRMGDLAYADDRARLWLVGRVSDAVAVGERTLYPIQVEARAETVPGVAKAGLLAWDGRALLAVQPADPARADDLPDRVKTACAEVDLPVDEVRVVPEVPTDPRHNAKVDRPGLRELLANDSHG